MATNTYKIVHHSGSLFFFLPGSSNNKDSVGFKTGNWRGHSLDSMKF